MLAEQFHQTNLDSENAAHQEIARRVVNDQEAGLAAQRGCDGPPVIIWIAEVVRRLQEEWNTASHGSPGITNLHRAISEQLGSEYGPEMSAYLQAGLDKVLPLNDKQDPEINRRAQAEYRTTGPLLKLMVKHMYAFTQQQLAATGIVELLIDARAANRGRGPAAR